MPATLGAMCQVLTRAVHIRTPTLLPNEEGAVSFEHVIRPFVLPRTWYFYEISHTAVQ